MKHRDQKTMVAIVLLPLAISNQLLMDKGARSRSVTMENNAVKTTLNDICFLLRIYFGMLSVIAIKGKDTKLLLSLPLNYI